MRCDHCGWENNDSLSVCEKCNESLPKLYKKRERASPPPPKAIPLKGTIKGAKSMKAFIDNPNSSTKKAESMSSQISCPNCKSNIRAEFQNCPYCQYPLKEAPKPTIETPVEKVPDTFNKTIRVVPGVTGESYSFSLTKLDKVGNPSDEQLDFREDNVSLGRNNLDAANKTISREQATIVKENGKRYLKNNSTLKSSFIQVQDDTLVELQDGMVLLFGNSGYIFKSK